MAWKKDFFFMPRFKDLLFSYLRVIIPSWAIAFPGLFRRITVLAGGYRCPLVPIALGVLPKAQGKWTKIPGLFSRNFPSSSAELPFFSRKTSLLQYRKKATPFLNQFFILHFLLS